jgi:hypothetical protein
MQQTRNLPGFAERGVLPCQHGGSPTARNSVFVDQSHYFFLSSSSSVVFMGLSAPHSTPTASQKIWESNPDLWICSHEL